MNKIISCSLLLLLFAFAPCVLTSCDQEEPKVNNNNNNNNNNNSNTTKISAPTFEKDLTTTTTMDVSFRCRFNNGGDKTENMSCTVHWRQYGSKPSATPKASDLTKNESMRVYNATTKTTTFDKSHSGFSGGTYIYYYFECRNSKSTTKSDVTYTIIKR